MKIAFGAALLCAAAACGGGSTEPQSHGLATKLFVSPQTIVMQVGETFTPTTTARDSAGVVITNHPVTWSSVTPSIASVDSLTGTLTAVALGNAVINVKEDTATTTANVIVITRVASVFVLPQAQNLVVPNRLQMVLFAQDSAGVQIVAPIGGSVTWKIDDGTKASISSTGLINPKNTTGKVLVTGTLKTGNFPSLSASTTVCILVPLGGPTC